MEWPMADSVFMVGRDVCERVPLSHAESLRLRPVLYEDDAQSYYATLHQ